MSTLSVGTIKSLSSTAPVFQNTSGTEIGQLAKAWVNFNGTGTLAIRDSFNVSSVTDVGTGAYTTNFSTSFSNTNYAAVYTISVTNSTTTHGVAYLSTFNTGSNKLSVFADNNSGASVDKLFVCGVFFGDN